MVKSKNKKLKTLDGGVVPSDAQTVKRGNRHFWLHDDHETQVYRASGLSQKRLLFYNYEPVPSNVQVYGNHIKHNLRHIIKDEKKIPVFTRDSLRKFNFIFENNEPVSREALIYQVDNLRYVDIEGQQTLIRCRRYDKKQPTIDLFTDPGRQHYTFFNDIHENSPYFNPSNNVEIDLTDFEAWSGEIFEI